MGNTAPALLFSARGFVMCMRMFSSRVSRPSALALRS
jgi:hypothetical protein